MKEAYDLVNFWSMAVDLCLNKKLDFNKYRRLRKRYGLIDPQDLAEARHSLNLAHKYRRKVKRDDALYRLEFLSKLAAAQEQHGNHSSAHHLRQLQHKEAVQKTIQWIMFVTKKLQKSATTFVTNPKADGTVEELTDKQALDSAIIEENLKIYHQTEESCPLFEDNIFRDIGPLRDRPVVQNILNGTYTPHKGSSERVDEFLQNMRKSSKVPSLEIQDCLMSQTEFISSWKQVKTNTSSIRPHIRLYKVATQHPKLAHFSNNGDIPL